MKTRNALSCGWLVLVRFLLAGVYFTVALAGRGATTVYYDEASYLAALAALGSPQVTESFESDAWNPARQFGGTNVVTSQGINWAGGDAIKSGLNGSRTGSYDVYGWMEDSGGPFNLEGSPTSGGYLALTAVGGWFHATTATNLIVSATSFSAPFGSVRLTSTNFTFLGIINPEGFSHFYLTTTRGNWWADDFTFGVVPKPECPPPPPVSIRASQVEVCWPSVSNVAYQVQYSSALTTNTWVRLFNAVVAKGTQSCITDNVVPGSPARIYRIVCPGQ